jgi:hypothetical protein
MKRMQAMLSAIALMAGGTIAPTLASAETSVPAQGSPLMISPIAPSSGVPWGLTDDARFRGQSSLGWVFLGRKVHLTESRNLPSASQSSTVNSTINALLSPRHTLHAGQPVSRSS